jgi:hypothetical protein
MKYHEPEVYSHEEVESIIKTGKGEEINNMLIGVAFNEPDLHYAFNVVKKYCFVSDVFLQGLAIECIADLARIHGSIPINETKEIFSKIIESNISTEQEIMYSFCNSLSDLSVFVPEIYQSIKTKYPDYCKKIGCYYDESSK